MNIPKSSYSTAYVAKRLGVSVPTIQRWVDSGRLIAWKTMGGHRRIDAESANEIFSEQVDLVSGSNQGGPVVVLVEDSPNDRDLIVAMLEHIIPSAQIAISHNGYDGLLQIGKLQPDLVITDIIMPTMDGFELISHVLNCKSIKRPVIIAVSSLNSAQVKLRGKLPKNVKLLQKPLEFEEMRYLLGKAFFFAETEGSERGATSCEVFARGFNG